jgi:DNA-binding XRE family transcriptional regulator
MGANIVRNLRTSQGVADREQYSGAVYVGISDMADSVQTIARRLVRTREALGFTQSQFCEQIGVEKNVYNPFEKGKRRITIEVAMKIRARFGISLDWIYCGEVNRLPVELFNKLASAA